MWQGIIGAIIGAIAALAAGGLGALLTWRKAKTDWDREDRYRHNDAKRAAYVAAFQAIVNYNSVAKACHEAEPLPEGTVEALERDACAVLVLAPNQVGDSMNEFLGAAVRRRVGAPEDAPTNKETDALGEAFVKKCREDLGLRD